MWSFIAGMLKNMAIGQLMNSLGQGDEQLPDISQRSTAGSLQDLVLKQGLGLLRGKHLQRLF